MNRLLFEKNITLEAAWHTAVFLYEILKSTPCKLKGHVALVETLLMAVR